MGQIDNQKKHCRGLGKEKPVRLVEERLPCKVTKTSSPAESTVAVVTSMLVVRTSSSPSRQAIFCSALMGVVLPALSFPTTQTLIVLGFVVPCE